MLELYRAALRIRHDLLGTGPMTWLPSAEGVLAFDRNDSLRCVVNISAEPVELPAGIMLLASGPLGADDALPPDTAVWLAIS
jgi:alpha-glucosidase